jgi:hypothetical protein
VRIFVSFASEQEQLAEPVALALRRREHSVFFSHDDLPPASNFDERIEKAIARSDIFVFLISPESVSKGRYTLTELAFARAKWPDPSDRVLPVMLVETPLENVPNYLKAVTILEPSGNTAAETAAAVDNLASSGWMAAWTKKLNENRGLQLAAIAIPIVAVLFGYLYWAKPISTACNDKPAQYAETDVTSVVAFSYHTADPGNPHVSNWSRPTPDRWVEKNDDGENIFSVTGRTNYGVCDGTIVTKMGEPNLQLLISDKNCATRGLLFRRRPACDWAGLPKMQDVR